MKKLALGTPPSDPQEFIAWAGQAIMMIEQASYEDAEIIFADFRVEGDFVPTRVLTPSTATVSDLANFLATLIHDLRTRRIIRE